MKIAIFTAGNDGKRLYEILQMIEDVEVTAFVDNNANLYGKMVKDIPVISIYRLKQYLEEKKLDMLLVPSSRMVSYGLEEYLNQLNSLGIEAYKIVPAYYCKNVELNPVDFMKLKELIFHGSYKTINQLQHLQFHVIDNCNLNCKRCQHFSNIAPEDSRANLQSISKDLTRLKELFDDINVIALMGGEPLLNPELDQYCYRVREIFPYSTIEIITNGLLIRKMSHSLIKAIKENNIIVNISYYPVLSATIDDIACFLKNQEIRYIIGREISSFSKKMVLDYSKNVDIEANFKRCRDRCCTTLREGKLYPCYLPATVEVFNDKFNTSIDGSKSSIDIYDKEITGMKILERLDHGFDICKHCTKDENYPWEQSKEVNKSDWLV